MTFTNGAWRALYGRAWAADIEGEYLSGRTPYGRAELRKRLRVRSLHHAIDQRLKRVERPPAFGALVTIKTPSIVRHALGISYGIRAVSVGEKGLVYVPLDQITGAWVEE